MKQYEVTGMSCAACSARVEKAVSKIEGVTSCSVNLLKYNSINGKTGKHILPGIDEPCPTVSCQGRLGVVQAHFLSRYIHSKSFSFPVTRRTKFFKLVKNSATIFFFPSPSSLKETFSTNIFFC